MKIENAEIIDWDHVQVFDAADLLKVKIFLKNIILILKYFLSVIYARWDNRWLMKSRKSTISILLKIEV